MSARESVRARQAWADYLSLGPGRSLEQLAREYQSRTESVPTRQLSRIKRWSVDFGWQARLQEIADGQARAVEEREAAYRRSIVDEGYALAHERVKALKVLAETLVTELTEGGRLWVTDVEGIGAGKNFQRIEVERFNAAEVRELRGLLDDIAKELGGRPKTVRVDIEMRVREMARELGLDPDEAVKEAEHLLRETRGAAPR